jgi:glutaredoxin
VFASHGTDKQLNSKSISGIFKRVIEQLKEKGLMDFEQKQVGKPRTVRLYNLRKFFRKFANQAGFEFVQFWMGHIVKAGQEENYRPQDPEFHRKLYAEKAMPFLRFETATPSESDKIMQSQAQEIEQMKQELKELRAFAKFMEEKKSPYVFIPDHLHGEERLDALLQLLESIRSDVEEVKKHGKSLGEKSQH